MIDTGAAVLALRNRLLGTTVATTGTTSLSATSTGYARAAGSFLDDGFRVGHELTLVTGFSVSGNNQATTAQGRVITAVTATDISCAGCATDAAASGRVITAGIPFQRAWENVELEPDPAFPFIEEDFVPGTASLLSMPYANGAIEEDGFYVIKYYGLADRGPGAIRQVTDAIRARFTPGTSLTAGSHTLLIRGDTAVRASQMLADEDGWMVAPIEIPWLVHSTNAVA